MRVNRMGGGRFHGLASPAGYSCVTPRLTRTPPLPPTGGGEPRQTGGGGGRHTGQRPLIGPPEWRGCSPQQASAVAPNPAPPVASRNPCHNASPPVFCGLPPTSLIWAQIKRFECSDYKDGRFQVTRSRK